MNKIKDVYKNYYKGLNTAIGGNERFLWIDNILLKNVTGKTILDVGCGEGKLLEFLKSKNNKVFGVDVSESGLRACKEKGIDSIMLDIGRDDFSCCKQDMFDIVLCLETIEHTDNPHHCLWEIKRVLKEGGIFIISIPNTAIAHPYIYPGLFEFKNFKKFLQLFNFEIIQIKGWGQAEMLKKNRIWLESRSNSLAKMFAKILYYLGRKRNSFMRNHMGTPLQYSHAWNFVCINHKMNKTLVEIVAETTDHHAP